MSEQDTTTTEAVEETTEDTTPNESNESLEDTTDDKEDAWDPERAKRKIAKLNSEAANLRKRVNEAPKAEDVAAKDKRITELETTALRYEVAFELGLPKQIAARLQGSTKEEMLADAEELVELVAPGKRPPSNRPTERLRGGGGEDQEPEETDLSKLGDRMFRR
jgi:hypothetical protein